MRKIQPLEGKGLQKQKSALVESQGKLLLRPLRESDIPSLIAIDERTSGRAKPDYWRSKLTRYLSEKEFDPEAEKRFLARVAEMDGEVVGFMIGDIRRWEFGQPACGWITALGISPDCQRAGIGRRLLAELLDYYRQNGLRDVRTIVEWADGDLLKFFHSMGFIRGSFVELEKSL